ncbi:D-erythronate dehydrogenase [Rhodopseudomonas sp. P2A-2r]|uniref:D-erythronate dehydrogenase n=1 Tax=unclassified Rhodopseudomonas TaxID=2638247 RepID=UPI002234323F|nr:D-erythronate dehydrogenase [Rhodopseudomonas sp. P2A-2r]UZE49235.1 SDR family oxidoreductase [Rhodopseudomonas sp. P2A-2r]
MKVLVIGAAGMIGRKLCERLLKDGRIGDADIADLVMADAVAGDFGADASFARHIVVDLASPEAPAKLLASRPDVIFHLAAIVSGEAEQNFDKGYAVNLDGTRALFEAIRAKESYTPRLVYTSSIAVFGAPYIGPIADDFFHTPLSSYGTQKAICELLLADYSRRGFFDGIGIRLPNICVRPGKPNAASSGFFSSIIREPLAGREAILPVDHSVAQTHASPRATVGFLLHAATLDSARLGARRSVMMPGVPATVGQQIAALRHVAGDAVVSRIRHVPDPAVMAMVAGWPGTFETPRALSLGFRADDSFESIIHSHIEDDLGGAFVG